MTTNKKNQKGHSESLPQRMERLIGSVKKRKVKEAADLVFDSWETADSDESYALLTEAVELDPRNVDAWRGLMNFEPLGNRERIAFLHSWSRWARRTSARGVPGLRALLGFLENAALHAGASASGSTSGAGGRLEEGRDRA